MLLNIRPSVGKIHFAVGAHVSKSIQDVRELLGGKILRVELSPVDCLKE